MFSIGQVERSYWQGRPMTYSRCPLALRQSSGTHLIPTPPSFSLLGFCRRSGKAAPACIHPVAMCHPRLTCHHFQVTASRIATWNSLALKISSLIFASASEATQGRLSVEQGKGTATRTGAYLETHVNCSLHLLHGDSDAQTTTTVATRLVARADARLPHLQGQGMDADLFLRIL
jgi:hypothetical protein